MRLSDDNLAKLNIPVRGTMRIQTKLILFTVSCSILPLLLVFIFSYDAARSSLNESVFRSLSSHANEELEALQRRVFSADSKLEAFSKVSDFNGVLDQKTIVGLQRDIDAFTAGVPDIAELLVADVDGKVVAGSFHKNIGKDFSKSWEFEAPKLGIQLYSHFVRSHRLAKVVTMEAMPLYSKQDTQILVGVIICKVNWETALNELSTQSVFGGHQSRQRQVYLEAVDDSSLLYASADGNVPYEVLRNSLVSGQESGHLKYDGADYLVMSVDSQSQGYSLNPNWRLHVLLDAEVAYGSVHKLRHMYFMLGASALVAALMVGYLISISIVRPVAELVSGAERIASGRYETQLTSKKTTYEIGLLADSFERMRISVRNKERELLAKTKVAEQAARLKGEFLANMSHEVRTPINGILGMTELLLNTELDNQQARYAKTISRSSNALLSVINDVLDFSKIEAGKLELANAAFDLREIAEDVTELVCDGGRKKGVEVVFRMVPGAETAFTGDGDRLRQVLTNLMGNAVKFTKAGEVSLHIDFGLEKSGKVQTNFKVSDTGIGINECQLRRIFDSFVQADGSITRQFGGTGLGLSISSSLVKLMGGDIKVSSEPGVGSEFSFSVDLQVLPVAIRSVWHSKDAFVGKQILVVDDNDTNLEILEEQIRFWGATPVLAKCAQEGLVCIQRKSVSRQPFDAIILDMHMPDLTGLQLAEEIQKAELAIDTGIMLLSSSSDLLDPDYCRQLGIYCIASKPLRVQELYRSLISAIERKKSSNSENAKVIKQLPDGAVSARVLLAEDNPVNQDMMLEMMRIMGMKADLASNGREALKALMKQRYDLVLMDCQMPVMDGFSATEEIRCRENRSGDAQRVPIIALTANAMQGTREKCIAHGMDDYLSKPVNSRQLCETLQKWAVGLKATTGKHRLSLVRENEAGNAEDRPVLDENVLCEVLTMCEQSHDGFLDSLITTYEESTEVDIRSLEAAIAERDGQQVGAIAHRLKSGSASWGATAVTGLLQSLEHAGKYGDLKSAERLFEHFKLEQKNLLVELRRRQKKVA